MAHRAPRALAGETNGFEVAADASCRAGRILHRRHCRRAHHCIRGLLGSSRCRLLCRVRGRGRHIPRGAAPQDAERDARVLHRCRRRVVLPGTLVLSGVSGALSGCGLPADASSLDRDVPWGHSRACSSDGTLALEDQRCACVALLSLMRGNSNGKYLRPLFPRRRIAGGSSAHRGLPAIRKATRPSRSNTRTKYTFPAIVTPQGGSHGIGFPHQNGRTSGAPSRAPGCARTAACFLGADSDR